MKSKVLKFAGLYCATSYFFLQNPQYLHDTRKKRLRLPPLKDGETHYVIAHRGGSMENPENTLQAFKHAVRSNSIKTYNLDFR